MTWRELRSATMKNALVRWTKSRRVERVQLSKGRNVRAVNLVTGDSHILLRGDTFNCEVVNPKELIAAGDLLPIWNARIGAARRYEAEAKYRHIQRQREKKAAYAKKATASL